MCYKVSGSFLVAMVTVLSGCDESALNSCPIILNPINAGQQIKLIPNQKVNEYAIALVCSSNTPVVVGVFKRCLSQVDDSAYITTLFRNCLDPVKNANFSTVLPTGKGQVRPIVPNTISPQVEDPVIYPPMPSLEPARPSHFTEPVPVQSSVSPSIAAQQTVVLSLSSSTSAPEVTQPFTESTSAPRSRTWMRFTLDIPDMFSSEAISTVTETSSTTVTPAPTSEQISVDVDSSSEFGFGDIFF